MRWQGKELAHEMLAEEEFKHTVMAESKARISADLDEKIEEAVCDLLEADWVRKKVKVCIEGVDYDGLAWEAMKDTVEDYDLEETAQAEMSDFLDRHEYEVLGAVVLADYPHEVVLQINLDARLNIINWTMLAQGDQGCANFSIKHLLTTALVSNATSFMLMHNHPDGEANPSEPDKKATRAVKQAAKIVGLQLVDHIITTPYGDRFSFAAEGIL